MFFLFGKDSVGKGWMEKKHRWGYRAANKQQLSVFWAEARDSLKSVRVKTVRRWRIGGLDPHYSSHSLRIYTDGDAFRSLGDLLAIACNNNVITYT